MPNQDLKDEVEAINSIYGDGTLVLDSDDVFVLNLPDHAGSLRLKFPGDYPDAPPTILGTQSSGEHKGDASRLLDLFRDTVGRLFVPGEVCLFTVIDEIITTLQSHEDEIAVPEYPMEEATVESKEASNIQKLGPEPEWVVSDMAEEKKSFFLAHAARVTSVQEAEQFLEHLLATDKKVAKASHNMTAWRIKGANGVTFQDCDDDGETAAGGRLLHLMQLMDLWDCMVVVSRWFSGVHIGPDRFRLINMVARDAFVKGNFIEEQSSTTAASKKKSKK